MSPELQAEIKYRITERLGILDARHPATTAQRAIAESEVAEWQRLAALARIEQQARSNRRSYAASKRAQ